MAGSNDRLRASRGIGKEALVDATEVCGRGSIDVSRPVVSTAIALPGITLTFPRENDRLSSPDSPEILVRKAGDNPLRSGVLCPP